MNKKKKKSCLESNDYYPAINDKFEEIKEIIKDIAGVVAKEIEITDWKSTKNPPRYNAQVILYRPETEESYEWIQFGFYESGEEGKNGKWFIEGDYVKPVECDPSSLYWIYRPQKPRL
jgi:hypothetical protein